MTNIFVNNFYYQRPATQYFDKHKKPEVILNNLGI